MNTPTFVEHLARHYRPTDRLLATALCRRTTGVYRPTQDEVTSQGLWSRYDRHFVGITRYNALSQMAKIYRVIQIKLNQLV